jgi:hypothetical protein
VIGAIDELAAVPDVDVLLDDSATRRFLTDWPAVLIASAAAFSQEVVLLPTTSITRLTLVVALLVGCADQPVRHGDDLALTRRG